MTAMSPGGPGQELGVSTIVQVREIAEWILRKCG